jgi:hypothetical protein
MLRWESLHTYKTLLDLVSRHEVFGKTLLPQAAAAAVGPTTAALSCQKRRQVRQPGSFRANKCKIKHF